MLISKFRRQDRAMRIILLCTLLTAAPATMAGLTTSGCSLQTSCTGTELSAGGQFTLDGVRFSNFVTVGVFGESSVRFTPYDDVLSPGFLVTRDNSLPLYRVAGVPVNATDQVKFDVQSLDNRAFLRRTLAGAIGEFDYTSLTYYVGASTRSTDSGGFPDLFAVCFEPVACANSTLVDTALFTVAGTVALTDYVLKLDAFIGETNPEDAVVELEATAFRLQVEPSNDVTFRILSGTEWLSHDTDVPGWQTVAFDDSAWPPARAPYPSPISPMALIPFTPAQFMWFDPDMTSNGTNGAIRTWYRYPFSIDLPGSLVPESAVLRAAVDDDYDLYVNGTLVLENHDAGFPDLVDEIDIASYLQDGDNLIAIYAVDGSWANPQPFFNERVLVDTDIVLPRFAMVIRSNDTWLSRATEQTGWQTASFDDSSWGNARGNYPNPIQEQALVDDTLAQFVWHDPTGSSDGGMGPDEAFFRYNFFLPFDPSSTPIYAHAKVNADDDYDLWVNGVLVFRNNDAGFSNNVDDLDFASALQQGDNVIAIRAADGSGDNPFPRGFERMMFEGLIATGDTDFANDADGDGLHNFVDNCIVAYNPGQTDTDGDGYGNACDADLNNDGVINPIDLGLMRQVFFTSDLNADMNGDGEVNPVDLGKMQGIFFGPPGPSAVAP